MKIITFWDIALCSIVEVYQQFRGVYRLHHLHHHHHQDESSVYFNETTQRYIPKGSNLHTCHHQNLKPH
jgi:hypothetical protein